MESPSKILFMILFTLSIGDPAKDVIENIKEMMLELNDRVSIAEEKLLKTGENLTAALTDLAPRMTFLSERMTLSPLMRTLHLPRMILYLPRMTLQLPRMILQLPRIILQDYPDESEAGRDHGEGASLLTLVLTISSPILSPTPALSTPPPTQRQKDWTQRQESSQLLTLGHTPSPGVLWLVMMLGITG